MFRVHMNTKAHIQALVLSIGMSARWESGTFTLGKERHLYCSNYISSLVIDTLMQGGGYRFRFFAVK